MVFLVHILISIFFPLMVNVSLQASDDDAREKIMEAVVKMVS